MIALDGQVLVATDLLELVRPDDQVAAQTPAEGVESGKNEKKKKKKKKSSSESTASSDETAGTTEKKKNTDTVKGRFGTTFVGDYDD